jgi:membrane fusion protein, multidrug efflux system
MRNILLLVCVMTIGFSSCKNADAGSMSGGRAGKGSGAPKAYTVLTLQPESVTVHKKFPATIEGQQVIEIRPMINGYISQILVNEGEQVRKGQLLFKIKNPQYEQAVVSARAGVNSAEAAVNAAAIEVEKVRPLVEKEIVSNYRLQSAELTLEARKADADEAKASLANAESNLGYTVITAPQDGIIGTIPYKIGALVSSSSTEPLTKLSDITNVLAYFSWNEKQLLDLLEGTSGKSLEEKIKNIPAATLILANSSEYSEKGKVEMASGLISTETGSATFKAVFPNSNGLIRSGSSATVSIPENVDSVLVVPQSATYELQDKRFIYKVGTDNKVTSVAFKSFPSDDAKSFFVVEGLSAGDRVVTEGVVSLRDGVTIIPKEIIASQKTDKAN